MATPALPFAQLASECEAEGLSPQNAEKIGHQLAKLFGVKEDEVGILRIEKHNLVFCYPVKLHNVGSIPLNTSSSVAVRTANTRRAEVINNFAQTKHTSVFEAVELSEHKPAAPGAEGEKSGPSHPALACRAFEGWRLELPACRCRAGTRRERWRESSLSANPWPSRSQ